MKKSSFVPYAVLAIGAAFPASTAAEVQSPICSQTCLDPVLAALPCYSNTSTSQELANCFCPNIAAQAIVNACVEAQCNYTDLYTAGKLGQAWCAGQPTESRSNQLLIAVGFLLAFVTVFVTLRAWSRSITGYKTGWDDWALAIATIAVFALLGLQVPNAQKGTGDHMWNVDPDAGPPLLKIFFAGTLLYIIAQVFTKLSLLLFYLRIFPYQWIRIACWIMLGWLIVHGVSFFFLEIFQCWPVQRFWDLSLPGECQSKVVVYYIGAAASLFEDIYILALPIPCISSLNMGISKKFIVCFIFALGSFASITSIVRLKVVDVYLNSTDTTWTGLDLAVWSSAEVSMAVICACLPTLRPLLSRYMPRVFGSESSSNVTSSGGNASYPRSFGLRLTDLESASASKFEKESGKSSTQTSNSSHTQKSRQPSSNNDNEDEMKLVPSRLELTDLKGMEIVKTTELTVIDTNVGNSTQTHLDRLADEPDPYDWEISYSRRPTLAQASKA